MKRSILVVALCVSAVATAGLPHAPSPKYKPIDRSKLEARPVPPAARDPQHTLCADGDVDGCKRLCDQDSATSCARLGAILAFPSNYGRKHDRAAGIAAFDKACKLAYSPACYDLALIHGKHIKRPDPGDANEVVLACPTGTKHVRVTTTIGMFEPIQPTWGCASLKAPNVLVGPYLTFASEEDEAVYPSSVVVEWGTMKANQRDGMIDMYPVRSFDEHAMYKAGQRDGATIVVGPDFVRRDMYVAGVLTGEQVVIHNPGDATKRDVEITHYKNGKRSGDATRIRDGRVNEVARYVDGVQEGNDDQFDRNGMLESRVTFVNGKATSSEHYRDGQRWPP